MSVSVAQAAAMGICVLARILGPAAIHPQPCRYCATPKDELLERIEDYRANGADAAEAEHRRLSTSERDLQLRVAQQPVGKPWYEEVLVD